MYGLVNKGIEEMVIEFHGQLSEKLLLNPKVF